MPREPLHRLDRLTDKKLFDQLEVVWRVHHPRIRSGGARSVRQAGAPLGFEAVELGAGLGRLRLLGVDFRRQRGYVLARLPVKTFSSCAPFIAASRFLIR